MLQWTRCSPAALSFSRSSSMSRPSEAQSPMSVTLRISRSAAQTLSTSSCDRQRPEVTMPIRSAPLAAASFAAFTHASVPTQPYVSHPVRQWPDCAHHLQSSVQRPERALMMEQKSNRFSTHRSVTSCARSRSSCRRSVFSSANASLLSILSTAVILIFQLLFPWRILYPSILLSQFLNTTSCRDTKYHSNVF